MRHAYKLYGGERGFTALEFRLAAEEIAGVDLKEWFRKTISSTDELDYTDALDWFGLQFAAQPAADTEKKPAAKKSGSSRSGPIHPRPRRPI